MEQKLNDFLQMYNDSTFENQRIIIAFCKNLTSYDYNVEEAKKKSTKIVENALKATETY
jgi:hypothetical protein